MNGVLEEGQAGADLFRIKFTPAAPGLFGPGPSGVLQRRNMGFGVWHETQDLPGGVTDTGDVHKGAVGIIREAAGGGLAMRGGVLQGDLAPVRQLRQDFGGGVKFTLPVADGQF